MKVALPANGPEDEEDLCPLALDLLDDFLNVVKLAGRAYPQERFALIYTDIWLEINRMDYAWLSIVDQRSISLHERHDQNLLAWSYENWATLFFFQFVQYLRWEKIFGAFRGIKVDEHIFKYIAKDLIFRHRVTNRYEIGISLYKRPIEIRLQVIYDSVDLGVNRDTITFTLQNINKRTRDVKPSPSRSLNLHFVADHEANVTGMRCFYAKRFVGLLPIPGKKLIQI